MIDEQIISKAVYKAVENGYCNSDIDYNLEHKLWEMIIFSHEFAKAFWGKEENCWDYNQPQANWQFHLQRIVLEEKPLKYLEKFL